MTSNILHSFGFRPYNGTKEEYINQLESLLDEYATLEELSIELLPYETEEEQEIVLSDLKRSKGRAKRSFKEGRSIIVLNDNLAMYPFSFLDCDYVVQIKTLDDEKIVTKTDGYVITTIIVAYNLIVEEEDGYIEETIGQNNEEGGED